MSFKYEFFSTNEIKPLGWTKKQLKIQASGLAGNLDRVWPDVAKSSWIGGNKDGGERFPYWLDGYITLAYLLNDKNMINKVKKYVDFILSNQTSTDVICPKGFDPFDKWDIWFFFLMAKALANYGFCSNDKRIPKHLYKYLHKYYELLSSGMKSLEGWAKYRWFEVIIPLIYLKKIYGKEEWMIDFVRILRQQGIDYSIYKEKWKTPSVTHNLESHIVNMAMMVKSEVLTSEFLDEKYEGLGEELYNFLYDYNGMPIGLISGDECLAGKSPIRGAELCSVVEWMYSFEWLYAKTGDSVWADRLEKVAFNALPATISDDMWAHQYDQACNQINAISFKEHSIFATNGLDAQVFGLEPEFGCCTANHGQGWPKFVRSSFMKSNDGIEVVVPIPCKLKTQWDGSSIQISLRTNYPFRNTFKYVVYCEKATNMKLHIRMPDYVDKLFVNGKEIKHKDHYDVNGFVKGITIINVEYKYKPILCPHYKDLHYVQCGSLVYSLFLNKTETIKEYEKDGVIRKFPYCDYEYRTTDSWSYAFAETNLEIKKRRMNKCPFSSIESPLYMNVKMIPIDWGYEDGFDSVCASYPKCNKKIGNVEVKKFVPYGCTKLRMTEMPLIKESL